MRATSGATDAAPGSAPTAATARTAPSHRTNLFDAIRLGAALTVVIGHAWPLTGAGAPPRIGSVPVFDVAVWVFFAISGYLVSESWRHDPRALPFLVRRASRIFPALIVVVAVTLLVIGPLTTTVGIRDYLASPDTWRYLSNLTLTNVYELPGVFEHNPRPVVNGTLWSLGPEFLCYLAVLGGGVLLRQAPERMRRAATVAVPAAVGGALACVSRTEFAADAGIRPTLVAMTFFAGGALIAALRVRMPVAAALVLGVVAIVDVAAAPELTVPVAWLALPWVVIGLGGADLPVLRSVGRVGDPSYGIYLWGFVVQQVVWTLAPRMPLALDIAVVVAITAVVSLLSWHLVEKRALAAGRRLIAHGIHLRRPSSAAVAGLVGGSAVVGGLVTEATAASEGPLAPTAGVTLA